MKEYEDDIENIDSFEGVLTRARKARLSSAKKIQDHEVFS